MFVREVPNSFQLNDEFLADEKVRDKLPQHTTVFVVNTQGVLLRELHTGFPQAIRQGILVDLLNVPVSQESVHGKRSFSDPIA